MATYQFRCDEHGRLEIEAAIGTAPPTLECPGCGHQAPRVFCAPMVVRSPRAMTQAFENAERSADEPNVVKSIPPSSSASTRQRYTHDPAHQRLPRL